MSLESVNIIVGLFIFIAVAGNLAVLFLLRANWASRKLLEVMKNRCDTCIYKRGVYYGTSTDKGDT